MGNAIVLWKRPIKEEVFFVNAGATVYPTRDGKAAMRMLIGLTNAGIRASVESIYLPVYA